eukprot:g6191.t1
MVQSAILDNDPSEMTSLLLFHAYESALVVADERDGISIWNYRAGEKTCGFSNTNPAGSRVTSMGWMNEEADALLYVGSDDGVVRVWSSIEYASDRARRSNGRVGGGGSGAGDHSGDLGPGMSAAVAGGAMGRGTMVGGELGGTELYLAGGDGGLNGTELKSSMGGAHARKGSSGAAHHNHLGPRSAFHKYSRSLSLYGTVGGGFGSFGGVGDGGGGGGSGGGDTDGFGFSPSGGDVVFWDLRGRTPVQVVEVHRSGAPMTALAVHGYAPLFASGSHNQFIKVFDFKGDVLSTIRYHDGFLGQRIGPVSSLAFHPHKPLLAAGATDSIVSIYSTIE